MGLNSGAVIPSMARKLQIGQILRKLQNFEKTQIAQIQRIHFSEEKIQTSYG